MQDSRRKRTEEATQFLDDMRNTQDNCLRKAELVWSKYEQERSDSKIGHIKGHKYL